ncbi:hypothetical protein BC628DRAFT_1418761 [Trametes gibbosa]|nr:hypothetical protein BC628DRAFT_1418761 [Trametes gibbosa]
MSDNMNNNTQGENAQLGQSGQQGGEKADWLDKGIQSIGNKVGVNIGQKNADTAGDFANKEMKSKEGFNLPGVH